MSNSNKSRARRPGAITTKKYTGGDHGEPMIYGVMLDDWDAWLLAFENGEGGRCSKDHRLQYSGEDEHEHKPSLGDCAEALWLEGAHPESLLMVLHASNFGAHNAHNKVVMLGTAVLAMACGIRRSDEHGLGDQVPEFFRGCDGMTN